MEIFIPTVSILFITVSVYQLNKIMPFRVCPICAGVSATWFLMTVGVLSNLVPISDYQLPIAVLMGGTIVGIAYQGEKTFRWAGENIFRFKVPVVILGFYLVYFAVRNLSWTGLAIETAILLALLHFFFIPEKKNKKGDNDKNLSRVKDLEEKMKNCC